MQTSILLRQTQPPSMDTIATALYQDACALAKEWSRGDELSMIAASDHARRQVPVMLMRAAIIGFMADGDNAMASMLDAMLKGRRAEMAWYHRDLWVDDLENAADEIEALAEEIATRFRKDAEGLAA